MVKLKSLNQNQKIVVGLGVVSFILVLIIVAMLYQLSTKRNQTPNEIVKKDAQATLTLIDSLDKATDLSDDTLSDTNLQIQSSSVTIQSSPPTNQNQSTSDLTSSLLNDIYSNIQTSNSVVDISDANLDISNLDK